ncbi:MAG: HEAT repeat domain-containing protein [Chloroflexota bacterium]
MELSYRPEQFTREYIDDQENLRRVANTLGRAEAIGVDLEMVQRVERLPGGVQRWVHQLALLQIASDELSVVIDPLRCTELSALRAVMSGPSRKVFLGGGQDISLLEQARIPARNVVDVGEIALGLFGRRQDGMAALAHRIFGLTLDKSLRRTDWTARPLHPGLVSYAHQDAELTLLIYEWMKQHHPEAAAWHERVQFEPPLAPLPQWLSEALESRSPVDARAIIMELGLDATKHQEKLAADVNQLLDQTRAPRLINKLLRVAGELELTPARSRVVRLTHAPSSIIRAAAARALGRMGDLDADAAVLEGLQQDPIEDVRQAAAGALNELRRPVEEVEESPEEVVSLDEGSLSALEQLRVSLE